MLIKTSKIKTIRPFLPRLYIPPKDSHKGQNGKMLIIGGSQLFHAASIWSAEVASLMLDMVHYSSTVENSEILQSIKKKFRQGIVISRQEIPSYVEEDDVALVGPGMVRKVKSQKSPLRKSFEGQAKVKSLSFKEVLASADEAEYAHNLTQFLLTEFPEKKFVLDAGAIQMMDPDWLKKRKMPAILTPHLKEFKTLFGLDLAGKTIEEKTKVIEETAKKYTCIILFKGPTDIVSDGKKTFHIEGGNAGLTKGGSGDVLASLAAAFYAKNDAIVSSVLASFIVKRTGDELFLRQGYWYNTSTIVQTIPKVLNDIYKSI